MRHLSLRFLLICSTLLSISSVVVPITGFLKSSDVFALETWGWLVCLGLAIYGLVLYRWRAMWLLLPVLVALYWPIVMFRSACNVDANICG